jgi:hypothetical protein
MATTMRTAVATPAMPATSGHFDLVCACRGEPGTGGGITLERK